MGEWQGERPWNLWHHTCEQWLELCLNLCMCMQGDRKVSLITLLTGSRIEIVCLYMCVFEPLHT